MSRCLRDGQSAVPIEVSSLAWPSVAWASAGVSLLPSQVMLLLRGLPLQLLLLLFLPLLRLLSLLWLRFLSLLWLRLRGRFEQSARAFCRISTLLSICRRVLPVTGGVPFGTTKDPRGVLGGGGAGG